MVLDGISTLTKFKLSVDDWIKYDISEKIQFRNSKESKEPNDQIKELNIDLQGEKNMDKKNIKKLKSGLRLKSALEIMAMPNMTLDIVEDVMSQFEMLKSDIFPENNTSKYKNIRLINNNNKKEEDINNDDVNNREEEEDSGISSKYEKIEKVESYARDTVESMCKYQNYLERQMKELEHWRKHQNILIPSDVEYNRKTFPSLKAEEVI